MPWTAPSELPAGWLWPHWLERQLDVRSPAFVATGAVDNVTGRSWTTLGSLLAPGQATVDGRGLVTPHPGGWSLDWWIGADDRWHLPSREVAVRQQLVDGTPVVETIMRVPGGDAVHRVGAVPGPTGERLVVEIENASAAPFAVVLAVRPVGPAALAPVRRIELRANEVHVDGHLAIVAPAPPARCAGGTGATGDSAATVLTGAAGAGPLPAVVCRAGLAQAAFVWPLAHRASFRVELPLAPADGGRHSVRPALRTPAPALAAVARSWQAQLSTGPEVVLPPGPLAAAMDAVRGHLLVARPGAGCWPVSTEARVAVALDLTGRRLEGAEAVDSWLDGQRRDGTLAAATETDPDAPLEATGAALWAAGYHQRLHPLPGPLGGTAAVVARAVEALARRTITAPQPEALAAWTWMVAGMTEGAALLRAAGEPAAADRTAGWAAARRDVLVAALAGALDGEDAALPGRPGITAVVRAGLLGVALLGVVGWATPVGSRVLAAAGAACVGPACALDGGGLDVDATLLLGLTEIDQAEPAGWGRLSWVLSAAAPTWTWPAVVHPNLGGGSVGSGHDPVGAATLWTAGRRLLVGEIDEGVALLQIFPAAWAGQPVEVHRLPTAYGALSFALRWHGERPALLWDLGDGPASDGLRDPSVTPVLRAPGLDPAWRGTGRRGEALLAPYMEPAPSP